MKGIKNADQLKRMRVGAGLEGNLLIQPTLYFCDQEQVGTQLIGILIVWRGLQRIRLNQKFNL